ncbi:unnamed protein product [Owenia fusiformis]|uniref:Uncharacterized protein n=1 Tax=Owenia fusiformis TaxID=6347 RepID=A0A8J1T5X3_OWEFU|nr:unnamed protein product [Owenia fusiformis]
MRKIRTIERTWRNILRFYLKRTFPCETTDLVDYIPKQAKPSEMLLDATEEDVCCTNAKIQSLKCAIVEPAGRWFEAYCLRRRSKQTISQHSYKSTSSTESSSEVSEDDGTDEKLLLSLDPKEWKKQDHYAVLGIAHLRCHATEDQIKRAYKKKVLKHHPDKRKARGEKVKEGDDDYFSCVTRAYETLGVPVKRRAFDSVDPEFNDDIPEKDKESREEFFEVFRPVFERNERWSNSKKKVPKLGDANSTWDDVNNFYSFWYDFDSWREYSYLDEEEKEKGENRDERRWIEQQNKKARQKLKKEEVVRIRTLVDNAYACDPRIQRFKDEEKRKKEELKKARKDAAKAKQEEEERMKREAEELERQRKEKEESEAKAIATEAKKEKEAQKKAIKKERKTMRNSLKDLNYFAGDDPSTKIQNMSDMEKLAEMLSLTSLQELNSHLTSGDENKAKEGFHEKINEMNKKLEEEKRKNLEASQKQTSSVGESGGKIPWSDEEMQLLIKAVNLFPAGTVERWETIAGFLTQHMPSSNRSAKEVLFKAKSLQKMDSTKMKDAVNQKAFDRFSKSHKANPATSSESSGSERFVSPAEHLVAETGSNPNPWTADEQKLLEQALKKFPASTPERWDKIADCIPTRGKKDCMKRFKELAEMIKAKKAAAAQAKTAKS